MSDAMMTRYLDPRICNVAIDANSLDRSEDEAHASSVNRFLALYEAEKIKIVVPKGVRLEFQHPHTPDHVKAAGLPKIFTLQVGLNSEERQERRNIELELQGNARPGKHAADADHLFEAAKYCAYFITYDRRILDRTGKLRDILPPSLNILTLSKFLEIFDDFEAERRV